MPKDQMAARGMFGRQPTFDQDVPFTDLKIENCDAVLSCCRTVADVEEHRPAAGYRGRPAVTLAHSRHRQQHDGDGDQRQRVGLKGSLPMSTCLPTESDAEREWKVFIMAYP